MSSLDHQIFYQTFGHHHVVLLGRVHVRHLLVYHLLLVVEHHRCFHRFAINNEIIFYPIFRLTVRGGPRGLSLPRPPRLAPRLPPRRLSSFCSTAAGAAAGVAGAAFFFCTYLYL